MSVVASQITSVSILCSTVGSGPKLRVTGLWGMPVMEKMFPFDDVIICKRNDIFEKMIGNKQSDTGHSISGVLGGLPWQHHLFIVSRPIFGIARASIGHNLLPGSLNVSFSQIYFDLAVLKLFLFCFVLFCVFHWERVKMRPCVCVQIKIPVTIYLCLCPNSGANNYTIM